MGLYPAVQVAELRLISRGPLRDAQLGNGTELPDFLGFYVPQKKQRTTHVISQESRAKQTFSSFLFFKSCSLMVSCWFKTAIIFANELGIFGHPELCCWFGFPADVFQSTHYPKQNSGQVNLCLSKKVYIWGFLCYRCVYVHTLYTIVKMYYIYMYYIYTSLQCTKIFM